MFRDTFDPAEWRAVYDSKPDDPRHFGFRHGSDLAVEETFRISNLGEAWIDVGCGTGHVAAELASKGLRVVGIDHDSSMIASANQQFSNQQLNFLQSPADDLPFSANSVDGIVATSFMGCLDSAATFYDQASRVLKPRGQMVLTFTNRQSLLLRINARIQKGGDKYHIYSAREVRQELQAAGFEVLRIRYYNFFLNPSDKIIPSVRYALAAERFGNFALARFLARNFLIVALKR